MGVFLAGCFLAGAAFAYFAMPRSYQGQGAHTMSTDEHTFALAYQCPVTKDWHYIPTHPEARKWRGPYRVVRALDDAINAELGADCCVTITTVPPNFTRQTTV